MTQDYSRTKTEQTFKVKSVTASETLNLHDFPMLINNTGATTNVTLTLPPLASGGEFCRFLTTAEFTITISPFPEASFIVDGIALAAGSNITVPATIGTEYSVTADGLGNWIVANFATGNLLKKSTLKIEGVFDDALNTDIHNALNVSFKTFNGKQYCAYLDNTVPARIVLAQRTGSTGAWSTDRLSKALSDNTDAHDDVGLGIDENGFIHIAGMTHGEPLYYFKMPNAESISGTPGANISMLGTNESSTTYPMFFNNAAGELYYVMRDGTATSADQYLYKYNATTTTWAAAPGTGTDGIFMDGSSDSQGVYISAPHVDVASNTAHFSFNWRDSTANHKVAYVSYDMTDGVFSKADGSSQTIPVTESNSDEVDDVSVTEGATSIIQIKNVGLLTNGNPVIMFQKEDSKSVNQMWMGRWTGLAWDATQITFGTASSRTGAGVVLTDSARGKTYVVYNDDRLGSVAAHVAETSDNGDTWSVYAITEPGFGMWNSKFTNYDHWELNKELQTFFIANSYRGAGTISKPIYMLTWKPSEDASTRPMSALENSSAIGYFFDAKSGRFIVKAREMELVSDRDTDEALFGGRFDLTYYGETTSSAFLRLNSARGTMANAQGPAGGIVQNGDFLGFISFRGHDGTYTDEVNPDFITTADIKAQVVGTVSATSIPTNIVIATTPDSSVTKVDAVEVTKNQDLKVLVTGKGIVLPSPDGTAYRIFPANGGGSLTIEAE